MEIKINTNISEEYETIEVQINSPERNVEIQKIENAILSVANKKIKKIVGMQGNDIFLIDISDIILFFSEEKENHCRTKDGIFRVKEKMYSLEEILPKEGFIRISNSAIININHVKCFNTSVIGRILVKFKDGTEEKVSSRRTSEIMKFLKERRD